MIISDFAIKRPMITVVTMVALVVFGLFALWRLQTDEFPDIQQPVVMTFIPYPGASPEGVEREILKPVEDAIKGISGVGKKIVDRLVLELKDKLGFVSPSSVGTVASPIVAARATGPLGQVSSMLVSLGFRPSEAERAIAAIAERAEGKDTSALLKEALAALG